MRPDKAVSTAPDASGSSNIPTPEGIDVQVLLKVGFVQEVPNRALFLQRASLRIFLYHVSVTWKWPHAPDSFQQTCYCKEPVPAAVLGFLSWGREFITPGWIIPNLP